MNNALEVGEFTLHFGSEVDDVNLGLGGGAMVVDSDDHLHWQHHQGSTSV